jgi:hypothetical protein
MRKNPVRNNRPVTARVHPLIYTALVGFALWFAAAIWGFDTDGYTAYLLVVVSGFILVAVMLPLILSRVARNDQAPDVDREGDHSFRSWAAGDLGTWQDRLKGANAAVEMLLPLAAAAFGMTIFGIVLHFTPHGGA